MGGDYDFGARDRKVDVERLRDIAYSIRKDIVRELGESKSGHWGGSLSVVEILTALYFYKMRHNPSNPAWADRDRLLLSKGHAAPALYAAFANMGYITHDEMMTLRKHGSRLQGHPDPHKLPGVEIPGGPEGIGLSESIGMALAARLDGKDTRVYVIMGDGEQDEGEVWEAAMAAAKFGLDHLTAIIDKNGLQQEGATGEIMPTDSLAEKWRAFRWNVIEVDGHSIRDIMGALDAAEKAGGVPTIIIASTVKGRGVPFMEGNVKYHAPVLDAKTVQEAMEKVQRV